MNRLVKAYAEERKHEYVDQLERIQCILQDISSLLATPRTDELSGMFIMNLLIVYFICKVDYMAEDVEVREERKKRGSVLWTCIHSLIIFPESFCPLVVFMFARFQEKRIWLLY